MKHESVNKEKLYKLYIEQKLALRQVAQQLGITRSVATKALKYHDIPRRDLSAARKNRNITGRDHRKKPDCFETHKDYIIDQYVVHNRSMRSLYEELGTTLHQIRRFLSDNSIPIKDCNQINIGKTRSNSTRAKMSMTAVKQIQAGTRSMNQNGRVVYSLSSDGKSLIKMRSSYEKRYAEWLNQQGIRYEYEPRIFQLSNGKGYVPDFYLPDTDEYVEIKGYLSDCQADKYELFQASYPEITWKILAKEDLVSVGAGVDTYKDVYMVAGVAGAGKSWVCQRLSDLATYVSYDANRVKTHLDLINVAPGPVLYDLNVKTSTFIRRHSHQFNIIPVVILESEQVVRERLEKRGGKFTEHIPKRMKVMQKRADKYGAFSGTADEVLHFLTQELGGVYDGDLIE